MTQSLLRNGNFNVCAIVDKGGIWGMMSFRGISRKALTSKVNGVSSVLDFPLTTAMDVSVLEIIIT